MTSSDQQVAWLERFFTGRNKISIQSINPQVVNRIQMARDKLRANKPVVLLQSYLDEEHFQGFVYYVVTQSAQLQSEVLACLKLALGTSHTFSHEIIRDPHMGYESPIFEHFEHGAIRIMQRPDSGREGNVYIEKVINQTIERLEERPNLETFFERPLGRVFRDFFIACRVKDGKTAYEAYEELKKRELVDHKNLLSLELQALAAGEHWGKIVNHPNLSAYLGGVVTQRIALLVLRATSYHVGLDTQNIYSIDWSAIRGVVVENTQYFTKRPNIPEESNFAEDWQRWAIFALAVGCTDIVQQLPPFISESWKALIAKVELNSDSNIVVQNSPLTELLSLKGTHENATKILEYAEQCYAEEVVALFDWLENLESNVRRDIKTNPLQRKAWHDLEALYYQDETIDASYTEDVSSERLEKKDPKSEKPASWNEWFEMVSPPTSLSYEYFKYWTTEDFDVKRITEAIHRSNDAETIRNTLPHLLTWVEEKEITLTAQLWLELIELISIDDYKSLTTLMLLNDLLSYFFRQPHNGEDYTRAIEATSVLVDGEISKKSIDTIFETFDLVLEYPLKELALVQKLFLETVLPFVRQKWQVLEFSQKLISKAIAKQLFDQVDEMFHLEHHVDEEEVFQETELLKEVQCTVGIYSLTESALQRSVEIIQVYCPNIIIKTNSDKGNTSALENFAKTSDIILFCNKSAAHQAYFAIKNVTKDIVYVDGKGASSIVRAFLETISSKK
ncbi:TPA: hypothetical protein NKQ52_004683 [Vibrio parahaemolyticus]|nr:hypothetical protein [Vibrio parahaemolyticus]MDF4873607.1 protein DpdD [Vibrio parahaemolyticus]HCG8583598.1 hypothetical protein [Vibrio parahaemolyticus]HCG9752876.1 hypothetical protein [Vibrio parahaemolyticus]HCH1656971.1 hypothetical protein [Vibrio parahaemolyticus]